MTVFTQHPPSRARLLLALSVALLAVSSAALWIRLAHAPALLISLYRIGYATILLTPFALPAARRELPSLTGRERWLLLCAGVSLAVHFAAWIASLAPSSPYATSVAASATLVAIHPVLVALATPWLLKKPVPRGAIGGIAVALSGATVIALGDASHGAHRFAGDLLALLGAAAGAAYFLLGARLRSRLGLMAYVLPVYGSAALTLALFALATGTPLVVRDAREHLIFLVLALGPMILGHSLLNWALGYLPAWIVSTTILAEPIASSVLVLVALGEIPPWTSAVGAAFVLLGLGLTTRASKT